MRIIEDIISNGHGWLDASYIVIHETANQGATAKNHVDYWSWNDTYAVHYVGDWTGDVYHCVPDDRLCRQVGNGNPYVIGIELCHAENQADFEKVWNVGVEWAALMLDRYGWGIDRLISHNDCSEWWGGSDHTDPLGYFEDFGKSWEQFKEEVAERLEDDMTDEQIELLAQKIAEANAGYAYGNDKKPAFGVRGKGNATRNNYNVFRWIQDLLISIDAKMDRIVKKLGA